MKMRGFTLVELLITVGVLSILAAIGVSSWQEAVTRARVVRVQEDMRTLATALETYRLDRNAPVRMRHSDFYQDPHIDAVEGIAVRGILSPCLSTPVAYMSSVTYLDPFTVGIDSVPLDEQFYTYQVLPEYIKFRSSSKFWKDASNFYGEWRLISAGPDTFFDHNFINSAQLPYDATNGTFSRGNIIRSQKHTNTMMPPIPALLAIH